MNTYQSALKALALSSALLSTSSVFAGLIENGLGVEGNFVDNGVTTLEYRSDGSVWEWLDLTTTNGISYRSIEADITTGDQLLNASIRMEAGAAYLEDIAALELQYQSGWATVEVDDVLAMVNSFFGTNLADGERHLFNQNLTVMEDFVNLFGDTYHEGRYDDKGDVGYDRNESLANIGYTEGMTSTDQELNDSFQDVVKVFDGQYIFDDVDEYSDYIYAHSHLPEHGSSTYWHAGTWLVRQATNVPAAVNEPGTLLFFSASLIGAVFARRAKRKSNTHL